MGLGLLSLEMGQTPTPWQVRTVDCQSLLAFIKRQKGVCDRIRKSDAGWSAHLVEVVSSNDNQYPAPRKDQSGSQSF